jgi:hypothetical protein
MGSTMKDVPCTHWAQIGRKSPASFDFRRKLALFSIIAMAGTGHQGDAITIPVASGNQVGKASVYASR